MYVSKEYKFSAAHRIIDHPKCGRLHGHNYRVIVTIEALIKDDGMVVDFAEIDKLVSPLIEAMDHRYLLPKSDDFDVTTGLDESNFFKLPTFHSTAEEMAIWLRDTIIKRAEGPLWAEKKHLDWDVNVAVWETDKCCASTSRSNI